ncbi:MAG: hypothetical protein NZ959_00745 [Armatimonadetes bacterium]|nr:hypothetical protein [Armatimonadota bacterium]MDW8121084.1 hypothetical protein [Armatimonadota bacterium]
MEGRTGALMLTVGYLFLLAMAGDVALSQVKPKRVAVITSSGVDNDFRSFHEYDGTLQSLGWSFDKFLNTQLRQFFDKSSAYDLVLTTSLWNYGDPQDLSRTIPLWDRYVRQGGIVILTDMAYPPMVDWLKVWHPELWVTYTDAFQDIGPEKAALDLSAPSRFLTTPHPIGALNYWAHFPRWGNRYQVWAKTKGGTAIGLFTTVGKGVLIVTTGWSFSSEMLQNLLANCLALKSGVWVSWSQAPQQIVPGHFKATLSLENVRDETISVLLVPKLLRKDGSSVSEGPPQRIALPSRAQRTIPINLPCPVRGDLEAVVIYKTKETDEGLMVSHQFRVPPLIRLHLVRTIFFRSDLIKIRVLMAPAAGKKGTCAVTIKSPSFPQPLQKKFPLSQKDQLISLSTRSLPPGRYEVEGIALVASKGGEKAVAKETFQVRDQDRPHLQTRIGSSGELLINGQPIFPIGTYHVGTEDLKVIKELGFNCVTSPIYGGDQTELTEGQKVWHDEANRQGLWVITELSEFIRSGRRNLDQARRLVSQLRAHPATILHYAIDEPLGGGIGVDLVREFCQMIKETDPDHLTFVNEVPGAVALYAAIGDITGTDPYPIGSDVPKSLGWVADAVAHAVAAAKGRPVWAVIQSHRQPPAHSKNRFPTPEEIRCMAYLALNSGAKGLLFYAWGDVYHTPQGDWLSGFKFSDELRAFFRRFTAELSQIGLHYALGKIRKDVVKIDPPQAPLNAVWVEREPVRMAVIVNPTSQLIRAAVQTPIGSLQKQWSPFEVHILR